MTPLALTALICTLCVAGIGAVYFVWVRKSDRAKQTAAQREQK
jgi:hypothetical protein